MATCPKCGTSILPNADRCSRCGAVPGLAGPGAKALPAVMAGVVFAVAGMGAAAFFVVGRSSQDRVDEPVATTEPAGPTEAAPTEAAPDEPPANAQRLDDVLARAREQIAAAKAQARDDETRRQLDKALAQTEQLIEKSKQATAQPEAVGPPPGDRCDGAAVSKVSRRNIRTIQSCYDRAIEKSPHLGGKLTLRVAVDASGRVESVDVSEDSIADAAMRACSLAAVKRWAFPASGRTCTASLTYNFEAK